MRPVDRPTDELPTDQPTNGHSQSERCFGALKNDDAYDQEKVSQTDSMEFKYSTRMIRTCAFEWRQQQKRKKKNIEVFKSRNINNQVTRTHKS